MLGSYSALQFDPRGGRDAWMSPSAAAPSVSGELLHCPGFPPPLLWLMVGFIYILFHQCCRTSKLSPLQIRGCPPPLGHPSGSLPSSSMELLPPLPGRQGCLASSPLVSLLFEGEEREEQAEETQFRIKRNPKGRE